MNQTQEIIVYSNPAEYAMWNSGLLFPIMVSAAVGIVTCVIVAKVSSYFRGNFVKSFYRSYNAQKKGPMARMLNDIRDHFTQNYILYVGAAAAVATFMMMV